MPAADTRAPIEDVLSVIDPSLLEESGSTEEDLRSAIRLTEESNVVDDRLRENAELLRVLQEAQWDRLRRAADARDPTRDSFREATPVENAAAKRLLDSMTSIMKARPRIFDVGLASAVGGDHSAFASMKANLIQPSIKTYYGVLDGSNAKAVRESMMTSTSSAALSGSGHSVNELAGSRSAAAQSQSIRKGPGNKKGVKQARRMNGAVVASSPAIAAPTPQNKGLDKMVEAEGARIRAAGRQ